MNEMPDLMRLAAGAARHAASRQAVIATNVANADTPGYRARDMEAFNPDRSDFALRRTHAGHMAGSGRAAGNIFELRGMGTDPNGNSVILEDQILRGIEASRHHSRAVTVYKNALDIMRASIGRN